MAKVDINVNISLRPPIVFQAPPEVIVIPDTDDVYFIPDIDLDIFFWNGWWWLLWEVVGIAHIFITGPGFIMTVFQVFILI